MLKIVSNIKSDYEQMEFLDLPDVMIFLQDNFEEFENHEIIAIVNFEDLTVKFIRAELSMKFQQING